MYIPGMNLLKSRMGKRACNNLEALSITKTVISPVSSETTIPGNTVAQRVLWARMKNTLTRQNLSELSGISLTTLSKIENNHCLNHDVKVIKRLAEALHQPIWFIGCYDLLPNDSLGEQIRRMRLNNGQYIQELADELGIDPHFVSRYEKGTATPPEKVNIKIQRLIKRHSLTAYYPTKFI